MIFKFINADQNRGVILFIHRYVIWITIMKLEGRRLRGKWQKIIIEARRVRNTEKVKNMITKTRNRGKHEKIQ